jgi:hypothetical protein
MWSHPAKPALLSAILALWALSLAPSARAQPAIDPVAQQVLAAMSGYLGGLESFSVEYTSADEVITTDGQKLQFLHSGEIIVQRPDKLYAVRRGAAGVAEMFLDGKELVLYAKGANAYLQLEASNIDDAIDALHKLGFGAPGADLLASHPLDRSNTDMSSGTHVGMTFIDGVEVHQLAFRGTDVDWQLWVTANNKPLPLRYVITTKGLSGSPEYMLQLRNWNTAPRIDAARFTFVPPPGARKLDPTSITVNAIGDMAIKGK